jgi:hypothetical protein
MNILLDLAKSLASEALTPPLQKKMTGSEGCGFGIRYVCSNSSAGICKAFSSSPIGMFVESGI